MARADLIKKLFISFKANDSELFYDVAEQIIDDEKKKNHIILANELRKILDSNSVYKKEIKEMTNISIDEEKESSLVEIIYPDKYFSDLLLSQDKKEILDSVVRDFINWDVLMSNGVIPNKRILFYGPPGCGKTIAAQALACELGLPIMYVRFDAVVSSYLGETASNLRKIFDYAKVDNWVIFFDEFDAIGRSRNDSTEHGEIKRVVNTFIQQLDNFHGKSIIIAATNYEKSLDYAIWRRFDETIYFNLPSDEEKLGVINLKLKNLKGPIHLFENYLELMKGFSHSDIEKICILIRKKCILEGKKIYTKYDIEEAIKRQAKLVEMRMTSY